MEKEEVIKIREILRKTGKNKNMPLRVLMDNSFNIVDESNKFQFTKWDDENGILYSFKLTNLITDKYPNNKSQAISVFAISYSEIQSIEIGTLPIADIDDLVENIRNSGCTFSDDFKNLIKHAYTEILHPDRVSLTPSDINSIIGPNSVNDKDDYYYGKYVESDKETKHIKEYNDSIKNKGI